LIAEKCTLLDPELLDMREKLLYFRENQGRKIDQSDSLCVQIRRDHILDNSFLRLNGLPRTKCLARFVISFVGDPGIDQGDLTRQWFNEVAHAFWR
jgi:hypothetical protein